MSLPGKPPADSNSNTPKKRSDGNEPLRRRTWQPPATTAAAQAQPKPLSKPAQSVIPSGTANTQRTAPTRQSAETHPQPTRRAIVSRGERTVFWFLLVTVLAMSIFLVRYRNRVDAHFQERSQAIPLGTAAPGSLSAPLLLLLANDETGALTERPIAFPLPEDPNTRARVVLEKLLSEYTAPGSPHPLKALRPGIEGVDEVFLAPAPNRAPGQLAVVDLTPGFIHAHPSGIEPETLTLLSMIATLHANLPTITEVRFLVDGAPRPTLAGHADLARTYLAGSAQMAQREAFTTKPINPK